MRKDTQEALERLERELLSQEQAELEEEQEFPDEEILFDDEEEFFSEEEVPAYNSDRTDLDLDSYSDEVYEATDTGRGELWFAVVILGLISMIMIGWAVSLL